MKKLFSILILVLISTNALATYESGKDIPDKDVETLYVKLMQTKTEVDVAANPMLSFLYNEYKKLMNDMLKVYTKNNVEDMPNWLSSFWLQKKDFEQHAYYRGLLCHYLIMGVSLPGKQVSQKDVDFAYGVYSYANCPAVHDKIETEHPEIKDVVSYNRVRFEGVKRN